MVSYIPILLEKRIGEGHIMTVHWIFLHCSISQHCPNCKNYHPAKLNRQKAGGGGGQVPVIIKNLRKGRYRADPEQLQLGTMLSPGVFVQLLFASLYVDFTVFSTWPVTNMERKKNRMNSEVLDWKEMKVLYQYDIIF